MRDKIEQIRNKLPDEVENIRIFRFQTSDLPVVEFSVSIQGEIERILGTATVY